MIVEGLHTFMSTMNLKILLAAGCVEGKVLNRTKDLVFIFQYVIGQNLGTESPFIHAITWKHPIKSATSPFLGLPRHRQLQWTWRFP